MIIEIFKYPKENELLTDTKIGDIPKVLSYEYNPFFNGVGYFSLTIPINSIFADKIEENCLLIVDDEDVLIVKNIKHDTSIMIITGYDLNGLLLDRITTYGEGQFAGTDGFDVATGDTETICKYYVNRNLITPTDDNRKIPKLTIAPNKGAGIPKDSYMARLENLAELIEKICGNAKLGWRIYRDKVVHRFYFDVYEPVDKTLNQITNPPVVFSVDRKNILSLEREKGISAEKNAFFVENGDTVTTVNRDTVASGINRREQYIQVNCDTDEVSTYAKKEMENYAETDSLVFDASGVMVYGTDYQLGDIITVIDEKGGVLLDSVIAGVQISYSGESKSVRIEVGEGRPKLIDGVLKAGKTTASQIRTAPALRLPKQVENAKTELETLIEETQTEFNEITGELQDEMGTVTEQVGKVETNLNGLSANFSYLYADVYEGEDSVVNRLHKSETEQLVQAGLIADKVSQTEYNTYVDITGNTIQTIETDLSTVEQTAKNISLTVQGQSGRLDGLDGQLEETEARIDIHDDLIANTVSKNGVISSINQSAEEISISAEKIKLEGMITANGYFKINLDGSVKTIKGEFGDWELANGGLYSPFDANGGYLSYVTTKDITVAYSDNGVDSTSVSLKPDRVELEFSKDEYRGAKTTVRTNFDGLIFEMDSSVGAWANFKFNRDVEVKNSPVLTENTFFNTASTPTSNRIQANDDLDDYTICGIYLCPSGTVTNTLKNCPHTTTGFRLEVIWITSGNYLVQKLTQGASGNYPTEWIRKYYNGAWGNWQNTQPVTGTYTGNGAGGRVITNSMILQTSNPINTAKTRVIIFDNSSGIYGGSMGPTNGFTAAGDANTSGVAYTYFAWNY